LDTYRAEHGPHNIRRKASCFRLKGCFRSISILGESFTSIADLLLRMRPSVGYGFRADLQGFFPAGILALKNNCSGFTQLLLVLGGTGFGCLDISAGFFDRAFGFSAPLSEYLLKRIVDQDRVKDVKQQQHQGGWHSSEQ
jgi:hypothetical protein